MSKNTERTPRQKLRRSRIIFAVCMVVYAAVALFGIYQGLGWFWDFIDAYEQSRPLNTVEAYIDQLTAEHICDLSGDLIAKIDHNVQPQEECRKILQEAVAGDITYAKKSSVSTDTSTVYVLRIGSQVIGSVTISVTDTDAYGFSRWAVSNEQFDLSYLIGGSYAVTVPSDYPVYINGTKLDEAYLTETGIRYTGLEGFYDDYTLPTMVSYAAGPFLGNPEMTVTDTAGNPVVIDENTDHNAFLGNCSDAEAASLTEFTNLFMERYIAFTGSANKTSETAYHRLLKYVVSGSDLAIRMQKALDGLQFAQSRGDTIVGITINRMVNIGGGKYIVDITYQVDTTGRDGVIRTTNNARFVAVETSTGLRAETITTY